MIARDDIKKQLARSHYGLLFAVIVFGGSFPVAELYDSMIIFFSGTAIAVIAAIASLTAWGPQCPFCQKALPARSDRIGNYCNHCGHSFDKKIPPRK